MTSPEFIKLENVKHIHLTAVCGTAMGALAGMLKSRGFKITGSDHGVYPPMSDYLRGLGIEIMEGFKPENLDVNPDLVIIGNTVKRTNPEAEEVIKRSIPYMHLPMAMSEFFLKTRHSIVPAGTHGKTTTTSLIAWLFESAGKDPGFLIGGIHKNFNANSRAGIGEHFIIEGDEYDSSYFDKVPKIWHYRPKTAIIASLEFDHGDIYRDIDHIKDAFRKFVSLIPEDGVLIACADYPHVLDVIDQAKCTIITYGFSYNTDVLISDVKLDEKGAEFTMQGIPLGKRRFRSPMWGRHNVANATAAILTALCHGIKSADIDKGLATFKGIKRRQEIIYDENDVIVIDDFAHHPTKVRETVKAVRARYPKRRLISIYEPRTNSSRRAFFQDLYPKSFEGSDLAIIAPVYNPGQIDPSERMDAEKLSADITAEGVNSICLPGVDEIVEYLGKEARSGDVILIMSNGGFGGIYKKLPERLSKSLQNVN